MNKYVVEWKSLRGVMSKLELIKADSTLGAVDRFHKRWPLMVIVDVYAVAPITDDREAVPVHEFLGSGRNPLMCSHCGATRSAPWHND